MDIDMLEKNLNPDPIDDRTGEPDESANTEEEQLDEEEAVIDELTAQEYASVDRALDEMLTFMDVLEERSDDLFTKMQELLADSRQARQEMQAAAREQQESGDSVTLPTPQEDPH